MHQVLALLDERLAKSKWLAGQDFTAADIMTVFLLTTKRYLVLLISYAKYLNILRYLTDIKERPANERVIEKKDPETKTEDC